MSWSVCDVREGEILRLGLWTPTKKFKGQNPSKKSPVHPLKRPPDSLCRLLSTSLACRQRLRFHQNPGGSFDGYPIRTLGGGLTASERDQSRLRKSERP